jgi:hypothetical protein
MAATPMVFDIDLDGDIEIGVGDYGSGTLELYFYVWNLPQSVNSAMQEWPMYQHDRYNTGAYGPYLAIFRDGFEPGDTSKWSETVVE